ncbi:fatty acid desaturase [Halomonas sp. BM-2019]|uniref:acyl-CoA desaturase n=1 Tax=Halomonas sp. BM-2019 TaxID=2811227 RepID=UPI001B3C287C|nr:MAG: fatty acid desaturase [Halomonas sp. BM-2019]
MKEKPPILWLNTTLFASTLLVSLIGVPWYLWSQGFTWPLWLAFIGLFVFAGISITAGYHRLWSHKAWDAHWSVRILFALGGALALQNSVLHWASDHREHHKHVDHEDKDPYSITRGFWFAHIGWMLREYQEDRYNDYRNVKDLQRDPIVRWQHKHYLALVFIMNIGLPLAIGLALGQVGGEGYHNFHHIFSGDYRNGVRWYHFDPTKWLILTLRSVGLAKNLRRTRASEITKARDAMRAKRKSLRSQTMVEKFQEELCNTQAQMGTVSNPNRTP